jgi:hypothetical protein
VATKVEAEVAALPKQVASASVETELSDLESEEPARRMEMVVEAAEHVLVVNPAVAVFELMVQEGTIKASKLARGRSSGIISSSEMENMKKEDAV